MLKIAVISDSHGAEYRLQLFAELVRRERFDAVIHCGDGVSDAKWLQKNLDCEVQYIAGNCDFHWKCARELYVTYGGVRMLAVHGDRYNVKLDLSPLSYYAEENCAKAALFGHTHQPFAGYSGSVIMVNPGALKDGRYAVLHIDQGTVTPFLKNF